MTAYGFVGSYFVAASAGFLMAPGIGAGPTALAGLISIGFVAIDFYLQYRFNKLERSQKLGWQ